MTTYQPTLTGGLAHEHVTDLLRQAGTSRAAGLASDQNPHRTGRGRPLWWVQVTARLAAPRVA